MFVDSNPQISLGLGFCQIIIIFCYFYNMTEQEIFEKLKDALDGKYLITDFGGTKVENIEQYLRAIKMERDLEKAIEQEVADTSRTNREFIHYLNEFAIGNTQYILEAFDTNEYNKFKGYRKVKKIVKDNKMFLQFEVDGTKLTADWQPNDNYGVWQTCGYCGDDYSGYLLFPTYIHDEYFCLEYKC